MKRIARIPSLKHLKRIVEIQSKYNKKDDLPIESIIQDRKRIFKAHFRERENYNEIKEKYFAFLDQKYGLDEKG